DEPATGFVEKNGMLALVLGERDEVRRLFHAHPRGDEMAIEPGIGASLGAACGNPQAQAVADAMAVGPQLHVARRGADVLSAKVRRALVATRREQDVAGLDRDRSVPVLGNGACHPAIRCRQPDDVGLWSDTPSGLFHINRTLSEVAADIDLITP